MSKLLLDVLNRKKTKRVPFWLMRQAGRYLEEYRKLRQTTKSFFDLVYTPKLAAEITLQPIQRFDMDAAILFSDILVVPHAIGHEVGFVEGEGPKLDALFEKKRLPDYNLKQASKKFDLVYETVRRVRGNLDDRHSLIGFAGSPWTVATYMIEGGGSKDHVRSRSWVLEDMQRFSALLEVLVEATVEYLLGQVNAGADALQLFDTWAGALPDSLFDICVIEPTKEIVRRVKAEKPDTPIIGFPRASGSRYLDYARLTGVDAVSIDASVSPEWAAEKLSPHVVIQGNLDPAALVVGGSVLENEIDRTLKAFRHVPHIFNLGHGIVPYVPVENVRALSVQVKNFRRAG